MVFIIDYTCSDRSLQFSINFSIECTIWLTTSLSYLVFITYHTRSNRFRPSIFDFVIDQTCKISHIVVLFGFHQNRHPIRLIMIVDYHENVDYTYTIGHIIVLFGFHHRLHLSNQSWWFSIDFNVEHTYMIDHIVVLYDFHHKPHIVK